MPFSNIRHLNRNVPAFDENEVRDVARDYYSLDGDFRSLHSERDQNFDIQCADGRRFVFRIANVDDSDSMIDLQVKALQHIAVTEPSLPVPRVLLNSDEQPLSKIPFSDGNTHIVHVLSYLDGVPLDDFDGAAGNRGVDSIGVRFWVSGDKPHDDGDSQNDRARLAYIET